MIEEYTILQLIEFMLFVPEIQRDYVWGSTANFEGVMFPFLKSIDENIQKDKIYNVGFLYSYQHTCEDNYVIDGQQRFTSIILLLYVLSVKEGKSEEFNKLLNTASPTMCFSYNVRPQTEMFMRKLFSSKEITKKGITNQTWYMPSYNIDITISSMINAIDKMASRLKELSHISYDLVLEHVGFWYFNVAETSQGEELYITMNSRGQKLTDAEQIKPHLFDQWRNSNTSGESIDYGKEWDEWEEYFYKCKRNYENKEKKALDISSVDIAMNTFIRIVYEMEKREECRTAVPVRNNGLDLPRIHGYMKAMREFAEKECLQLLTDKKEYQPLRMLKALIAEGLKPVHHDNDTERVERIFSNIFTRRKYRCKHNDYLQFLHEYSVSSSNLYDFILGHDELSQKIFDEHELSKIRIYNQYSDNPKLQKRVELAFSSSETMEVWSGNIKPIICWSLETENDISSFNIDTFESYASKFTSLFADKRLKDSEMDIVRRALLASRLNNYPRIFKGYTNMSFASAPEHWHTLFLDEKNIPLLKSFLDKYKDKESLERIINEYPIDSDYSEFVHIPELMCFCKQKNFQWWGDTIYLIKEEKASSEHANIHTYKYYLSRKDSFKFENWKELSFNYRDNTYVHMDFNSMQIAFDAMWNPQNRQMGIEVFAESAKETEDILKPIIEFDGYVWNGNRYVHYFDCPEDEQEAFLLMDESIKKLVSFINNKYSSSIKN